MTSFVMNPYLGDVNPGTTKGLKLYNKAITAPNEQVEINQDSARDIQNILKKILEIMDGDQRLAPCRLMI